MNQFLDFFAILAILFFTFESIRNIERGLLFGILIKPLVDTGWDFQLGAFSLIDIHSILFLWFGFQLVIKKNLFRSMSPFLIFTWFFAHIGLIFYFLNSPLNSIEGIIKVLFFPLALVILPYYWNHIELNRKLIKYLFIASFFPVIIILSQSIGLIPIESIRMTKGFTRLNGFYHDIITSRIYIVQGLMTLYIIYKTRILKISNFGIVTFVLIFLLGGFFLYSKAFAGIILLGIICFLITNRKKSAFIGFGILIFILFLIFHSSVQPVLEQMFRVEIEYNSDRTNNSNQLFGGRGMLWSNYLNNFNQTDTYTQILGFNVNDGRTHNEFLRVVILSGLFGLIAYSIFIIDLFRRSTKSYFRKGPLSFITLWCMGMLLLDGFSVVWGLYPYYMIMIIGFMFIAIKNNNLYPSGYNKQLIVK